MWKRWSVILLSLTALQSAKVGASDIIGNGGDAVDCPNSIETLDLYESRTLRGLNFDPSLLGQDEYATVNNILDRLEAIDPVRTETYRAWAAAFPNEVRFVPDADLTDIPDSQHLAVPTGCVVSQAVIQVEPVYTQDPRYIVSEKLWDRMDITSRAAMILHEIIYREALARGQANSIASRYLNSLVSSTSFATLSKASYLDAVTRAQFHMYIPLGLGDWSEKSMFLETEQTKGIDDSCKAMGFEVFKESDVSSGADLISPVMSLLSEWMPGVDSLVVLVNVYWAQGDAENLYHFETRSGGLFSYGQHGKLHKHYHFCVRN
jgi:hypothetical protein